MALRVQSLEIKKLFGYFDHSVTFKLAERITIIHGPNGVGKTTVLKIIHDLFNSKFSQIEKNIFDLIVVRFSDNSTLTIKKIGQKSVVHDLSFVYRKGKEDAKETVVRLKIETEHAFAHLPLGVIDDIIPHLDRIAPDKWRDQITDEVLTISDVITRYGELLPGGFESKFKTEKWLKDLMDSIHVHFIQTQRLLAFQASEKFRTRRDRENSYAQNTVEKYSKKMSQKIQENLERSGTASASLDRTFPHRLIKGRLPSKATESNLRKQYQLQSEFRKRLMEAGLIDAEEQLALPEGRIKISERKVLWYYLTDVDEKLKVFEELLNKIELFKSIINTRFRFKKLALDKIKGFMFYTEDKTIVPPSALSSGEQHELVLGYELLFEVREKSMILIDEPELSLHVTWQHKFLDDLKKISELADLDFVIATHSPAIIHKRRDLMIGLGEKNG